MFNRVQRQTLKRAGRRSVPRDLQVIVAVCHMAPQIRFRPDFHRGGRNIWKDFGVGCLFFFGKPLNVTDNKVKQTVAGEAARIGSKSHNGIQM